MEDETNQDKAQKSPSSGRRGLLTGLLVIAAIAGPLAFGYLLATERYGLAQSAIIGIAALSGLLGYASRRMILGGLIGLVAGLAGAMGRMLSLSNLQDYEVLLAVLGVLAGLTGIPSVVVGSLAGLAGDRLSPSTGIGHSPDSSSAEQFR